MAKEGKATVKKTDGSLVDVVILSAAIESEHYEIAVYVTLTTNAEARGASDVADLLRQNLEQSQHALDVVRATITTLAQQGIAVGAGPTGARRAFARHSERLYASAPCSTKSAIGV